MKRLDSIFGRAQQFARNELICYCNCDIILTQYFQRAFERLRQWQARFLMVGRRWDTPITEPIDFSMTDWDSRIVARARAQGI
jgi:hypothetical protein